MKLVRLRESLRSTFWFVPALFVAAAAIAAVALVELQRRLGGQAWQDFAFSGGAESARTLLSTAFLSRLLSLGLLGLSAPQQAPLAVPVPRKLVGQVSRAVENPGTRVGAQLLEVMK